jgi:hypothetical protein
MTRSNVQPRTSNLPPLRERDLFHLWEGQRFPAEALVTARGERLRAVYRGRPGRGAGPDFRDAIIAGPEGLLQGDVELHVRSADFRRHGHHLDPAYDGLALHVVFEHDGDGEETELACGRRVPVVALAGWLERREREIRGWMARPVLWEEPCRSAVERLGADATGAALDRLGEMRFRQKSAAFGSVIRNSKRAPPGRLETRNSKLGPRHLPIPPTSILKPEGKLKTQN